MHEFPRITSHRGQLHTLQLPSFGGCSLQPSMATDVTRTRPLPNAGEVDTLGLPEPKLTLHAVTEGEGCLLEDPNESRPDNVNMGRADARRETSSIRTDRARPLSTVQRPFDGVQWTFGSDTSMRCTAKQNQPTPGLYGLPYSAK